MSPLFEASPTSLFVQKNLGDTVSEEAFRLRSASSSFSIFSFKIHCEIILTRVLHSSFIVALVLDERFILVEIPFELLFSFLSLAMNSFLSSITEDRTLNLAKKCSKVYRCEKPARETRIASKIPPHRSWSTTIFASKWFGWSCSLGLIQRT